MAKIYSNADCVLVWLGEPNSAIHAAFADLPTQPESIVYDITEVQFRDL
jgi:hypothetical protein